MHGNSRFLTREFGWCREVIWMKLLIVIFGKQTLKNKKTLEVRLVAVFSIMLRWRFVENWICFFWGLFSDARMKEWSVSQGGVRPPDSWNEASCLNTSKPVKNSFVTERHGVFLIWSTSFHTRKAGNEAHWPKKRRHVQNGLGLGFRWFSWVWRPRLNRPTLFRLAAVARCWWCGYVLSAVHARLVGG